jgi:hypothetical protein
MDPQTGTHIVLRSEAEFAIDREAFHQLAKRRGTDTLLTWVYQEMFNLPRQQATDMDAVRRG